MKNGEILAYRKEKEGQKIREAGCSLCEIVVIDLPVTSRLLPLWLLLGRHCDFEPLAISTLCLPSCWPLCLPSCLPLCLPSCVCLHWGSIVPSLWLRMWIHCAFNVSGEPINVLALQSARYLTVFFKSQRWQLEECFAGKNAVLDSWWSTVSAVWH